jgi:hypothetical protein
MTVSELIEHLRAFPADARVISESDVGYVDVAGVYPLPIMADQPIEQFTVHYDEWTALGIIEPFEPTETAVLISVDKRPELNPRKEQ